MWKGPWHHGSAQLSPATQLHLNPPIVVKNCSLSPYRPISRSLQSSATPTGFLSSVWLEPFQLFRDRYDPDLFSSSDFDLRLDRKRRSSFSRLCSRLCKCKQHVMIEVQYFWSCNHLNIWQMTKCNSMGCKIYACLDLSMMLLRRDEIQITDQFFQGRIVKNLTRNCWS